MIVSDIFKVLGSYTSYSNALTKEPERVVEFVDAFLAQIKEHEELNAFVRVYDKEARAKAMLLKDKFKDKSVGALGGMLVGIKDMFCYKDHPVQASSAILDGFISQFNASVIKRLLKEDAIIIGHQNGDEFGMGSSSEHSVYGPVHNALDINKVAGGSSGGSAVGVQANLCHVSLGTDTGGSVRQPAAFCGIVGLKPTYSLIPRDGVIAYASSFDTVGIFAHEVEDCARVLKVIAGCSKYDNTSSKKSVPDYTQYLTWNKKAKIGYFREAFEDDRLSPCIKEKGDELLAKLRSQGHEVSAVDFPMLKYALPTYYVLTTAEASSNLARYDGVRYGRRVNTRDGGSLEKMYRSTRTMGFGKKVQERILLGNFVLSSSYYDAYYVQAQKVRRLIKESIKKILNQVDFIVLPTTPTTAFSHDRKTSSLTTSCLADLYTVPASLTGIPAISLPFGKDKEGMPIGMQFMANSFEETKLLAFSKYILKG